MKQKLNTYTVSIIFKHLPHWRKRQIITAKSEKKACDMIRRMYKDKVLDVEII